MPFSWPSVKPSHQVLIGAAIGVIALAAAFSFDKWQMYRSQIADAKDEARRSATLLARHTDRAFDGIDAALREVSRLRLDNETVVGDPELAHRFLKAIHGGTPVLKSIGWVNSEGQRTVTSFSPNPPPVDLAEDIAFQGLRAGSPDSPATFVSAPFYSDVLGSTAVFVARRTTASDGRFLGVSYGLLDPTYFSEVFEAANFRGASVVTLSMPDGIILASRPGPQRAYDPTSVVLPFSVETVEETLGVAMDASLRTRLGPQGEEQIVGAALTEDRRFLLSISTPVAVALADFYDELFAGLWRVLFAIGLLLAVACALLIQTRRREALGNQLRESERQFRDFAAASGDWFWETDAEHRITWISMSVKGPIGASPNWHMGKRRRDLCSPHLFSDPRVLDAHEAQLDRHEPFSDFEYPRETADGLLWVRTSGVPVFDPDGTFKGYRGSARDITDFVDAKARLKDATDAIPGGFLLFDDTDRLVYKNAPTQQPTGLAAFETPGETFESMIRRAAYQGMVEEAKEDPEAWIQWRMERHRAANRPSLIHVNGRAIELIERPTSDGGRVLLRFDVTDRELAYEELRQARDAANAANQAKSDFLASMSHELRTPLNAIIGFGEILERLQSRTLSPEQISEYSGYIVSSGRLLLNLVSEVLDLSSVESGHLKVELQSVSVRAIVERAVENVRPLATQRNIDLQVDVPDAAGNVLADSQRAIQVLINLLSNAVKYNKQSGTVLVEAHEEHGQITVKVTDSGPGIDPKKAARLFSPFDRLGAEFGNIEGSGIGLALSKRLVAAMSGRIGYHPAQPTGSTFWISLPTSEEAAVSAALRRIPARLPQGLPDCTVLCVEDNAINMRIVEHLVDGLPGVALLEAATGTEGLNRAQTQRPDVIFLDLNLPDMSGYDVLAGLRADPATSEIPVIALTASAMVEDIQRGEAEGFFRYLTKPLDFDAFIEALAEATGGKLQRDSGRLPAQVFEARETAETVADPVADPAAEPAAEPAPETVAEPAARAADAPDAHLLDLERVDSIRSMIQADIFAALLDQLVEDIERQAEDYGRTVANDDLTVPEKALHSLKGQCLNMGATALGELASRLCEAARRGDRAALEQAHAEFAAVSAATAQSLRADPLASQTRAVSAA
ncbi:MAG: ATP-binding protein [Thalassobaculaceae bacterium]